MSVDCFLDTNILLYAATGTQAERAKREKAQDLIASVNFGISTQVLQEFYVNATRKVRIPMPAHLALEWMDQLDSRPCVSIDPDLVRLSAAISIRYRISYWDAAILAAAEALDATVVYSEDLAHDQAYGAVRVENPFR
jgi:predicted nucleic acid-binding protein